MSRRIGEKTLTLIFYHGRCLDGFAGAWAAWTVFKEKAEYRPLVHEGGGVPSGVAGRDVIFIDYCFDEPIMKKIKKQVRSLTIIDHHISHKHALSCADTAVFDLNKSGCVLAWEYFHPRVRVPRLLLTIQDGDLFTLKRPLTLEYTTTLRLADFDFALWNRLVREFETAAKRKERAVLGSHLLAYKRKFVERLLSIAEPVRFLGISAYAVNTEVFYSETAVEMYRTLGVHLGIAWYYKDGKIKVSLRSDGSVDTSKLAARYGGGGHIGASAFWASCPAKFPWTRRSKGTRQAST
jgi:hypothetical protein